MPISKSIFFLAMIMAIGFSVFSQQQYGLEGTPNLKVSGTSTLHDWDMVSEEASGTAKLVLSNGAVGTINEASFNMPAASIKSGRRQMDNNAYSALQTDKHRNISFVMSEAKKDGGKWMITGMLDLAGVKKPVTFNSEINVDGNRVTLISVTSLKLTTFGIEPPTAVLGTIRTGDDVTLTVQMTLKPIL
jgi:hypothetical protein